MFFKEYTLDDGYKGNPLLRHPNIKIEVSQEQIIERLKCKHSLNYFMHNYVYIEGGDSGTMQFKPYGYQDNLAEIVENNGRVIVKMPRQAGKSTILAVIINWYLIFNPNFSILIAAHTREAAIEFMDRIRVVYENLPPFLQWGIKKWNVHSFRLENDSRVQAVATSKGAGRGSTRHMVVLDEFAFVDQNVADAFYASIYPTIKSKANSKMVIISTPNGLNHYHAMWEEAESGQSEYVPYSIKWDDVPGRGEEFKQSTIRDFGIDKWEVEFECKFAGSAESLIAASKMSSIPTRPALEKNDNGWTIFERPNPNKSYMITVDTGRGKGLDYSAFVVFDITSKVTNIVAHYKNNKIDTVAFPREIELAARTYNECPVLLELNDLGKQVSDLLYHDYEYENIMGTRTKNNKQILVPFSSQNRGVTTSQVTRRIGCSYLKTMIENDKLVLNSIDIKTELSNFVLKGNKYQADSGYNDDLVMCMVIFAWATSQDIFLEMSGEFSYQDVMDRQSEDAGMPMCFFDDGS